MIGPVSFGWGAPMDESRRQWFPVWLFFRALRWLLWIAFLSVFLNVHANRESIVTSFGHLPLAIETAIFSLGIAAVFAGFLELMTRERAGIPRPAVGRNWLRRPEATQRPA
jgi:hypothetical protein